MPTRSPLSVLFLTLYPNSAASPRYRVAQFLPYLRSIGFRCSVECAITGRAYRECSGPSRRARPFWYHAKETPRRVAQLLRIGRYDVVVVQKAIASAYVRGLHSILRTNAKRLVYDIDDAVHLAPPHSLRGPWSRFEDRDQVLRVMEGADLVLAGNAWLCSEARGRARRVEFFPTVVDTERFTPGRQAESRFTIGWIGSPSTTPHLRAADAVGEIDGASIRCIGADARGVPWKHADVRPWAYDREVDDIRSFSAGIMPLEKDDWTRGKCALKALQYMACGVPCVATPFGAVLDIIADNVNGLFADSPEEWRAAVEWLRDPAARATLGAAGRTTVEQYFALNGAAPRLAELLESVV
ncbi:MAG: glycosyltransferase family 4 protein [Candidatus Hydrogenedentes bacterium]|nr:glycosyltransferase family 4 protein [Candidatus Hydrogenedentota bacterium]